LHDLELWKDGICGLNCNVHASANLAAPSVTLSEAATIHNDLHNRYVVINAFILPFFPFTVNI